MIISEEYTTALNDLNSALEIQKKLFTPHDRRIAETHYHIGRCYRNSNEFENAAKSFEAASKELQAIIGNFLKLYKFKKKFCLFFEIINKYLR